MVGDWYECVKGAGGAVLQCVGGGLARVGEAGDVVMGERCDSMHGARGECSDDEADGVSDP